MLENQFISDIGVQINKFSHSNGAPDRRIICQNQRIYDHKS